MAASTIRVEGPAPTAGDKVAAFAAAFGMPLTPWQRHVVDRMFEIDPVAETFKYRQACLSNPRL